MIHEEQIELDLGTRYHNNVREATYTLIEALLAIGREPTPDGSTTAISAALSKVERASVNLHDAMMALVARAELRCNRRIQLTDNLSSGSMGTTEPRHSEIKE